jgi:hypothetical protein
MSNSDPAMDKTVCTEIEITTLFQEFPNASLADLARIAAERDK